MAKRMQFPKSVTTVLVYMRPFLIFGGLICAIAVMWGRNPVVYMLGTLLLFISMSFDLVDGWFAARYHPDSVLAELADRIMDKVVYSIIFPLIAVGVMWRLVFISPDHTRAELLHAILTLILCVTVLVRDNFAHFMRGFAIRQGQEPEASELNRLRTVVAAPVAALLYAYAFYVPEGPPSRIYFWISWLGGIPPRGLILIEITFLIINFGSIAGYCRKYGNFCLDELCMGDNLLRRRILTFFPNALTVMNAMMGLLSVFFAYQSRIREAYLILIGAALFDKLDGALARRLGLTEPLPDMEIPTRRFSMGGLLDDIADAISFCIVPAWIFYICFSQAHAPALKALPYGWAALLYAVFGFVRLAYFTLDPKPIPGFFKGLPTPAGALLVMAPLIMLSQVTEGAVPTLHFWGFFSFATIVFASVLMNVYPIRYLHYGRLMSRRPLAVSLNMLLGFILIFTPYFGYFVLLCMLIYVISPVWTWRIDPEIAAREARVVDA